LQTLDVGSLLPLHATGLGKVLLAYDVELAQRAELTAFTRRTIVAPKVLARALGEVRDHGWAADTEEHVPGVASIAAPIRGYGGLVVGAIGVSGAVERICDGRGQPSAALVGYVRDAAYAVSRDLGAARW
jgi:DNA-binding IclR family transcriptional regulator